MPAALLVAAALAACTGPEPVVERPPDAFGWVIGWEQSPDYRYQQGDMTGSVTLTLLDGTSFAVGNSTIIGPVGCQALYEPDAERQPCWLHVGLADDGFTAEWIRVFEVRRWEAFFRPAGTPVPNPALSVGVAGKVAAEHDGLLVLTDRTVLPFDRTQVEVLCPGRQSIDTMLAEYGPDGLLYVSVDQYTGEVTQLDCIGEV